MYLITLKIDWFIQQYPIVKSKIIRILVEINDQKT